MKKSKFTGEQIAFALRQAEVGTPVADVCRKMGISEAVGLYGLAGQAPDEAYGANEHLPLPGHALAKEALQLAV